LRDLYVRQRTIFDSLIYLEPVERFKNRSNVMKVRSFGDSRPAAGTAELI